MKVQVTLSDEMVKKIDEYAKAIGTNRSAFCAIAIGEKIMTYEKAFEKVEKLGKEMMEAQK